MTIDTRRRMVAGAADLMSRRGVNATNLREVVRYANTPRGSLVHHFPRGRLQLLEEALQFAGSHMQQTLETLSREQGVLQGLRSLLQA